MISVNYKRLRMSGKVESLPAEGLVLVHWDTGGSTRIKVSELEAKDDCYDENGRAYPRGRCDTCGEPCDDETGDCTQDSSHATAIS